MPWVPEDDPTLQQLRDWRRELNAEADGSGSSWSTDTVARHVGESGEVAVRPAVKPAAETGPGPGGQTARPQPLHADFPPSAPPRRRRHGRREGDQVPGTGAWAIPGLAWPRQPEPVIDEPARPVPPRPLPAGRHVGWDVTRAEPAPPLSPDELAKAQASTVAFPALDLVPVGENVDLEIAIEAKGLRKVFNDQVAVDGVSFSVPKGRIIAILGPNGAGKTTTVNMLCTLLKPDGGSATVNGFDVEKNAADVRRSVMLTGQFAALDEGLTGRENLVMFGRLLGLSKAAAKRRAAELLATFGLEAAANRKVGQYSGGMRRRIDIACGLVTQPTVVFLDEPTTGLDPRSRQEVWALVEKLRSQGVTVLLTTQYLEEADVLSDRIVVIDHGKVIAEGTSDELKSATGAAYCEVTPVHPAYLPRLRGALKDLLGPTAADVDTPDGTLSVPAPDGPATLSLVLKRTERAEVPLADIALRRPSLDEVFLALTDPDAARTVAPEGSEATT
ncbi:ATP-binding cassette domain-containing protein [Gordonia caeni]|uniref:ATP-binding cassette domain-containing protein n=1 Tax=Gordonia caeni TaxID=1007097 RepID=UPI0031D26EB5